MVDFYQRDLLSSSHVSPVSGVWSGGLPSETILGGNRQMSFRIGITIGDVVEQESDLLGDGVNIAARLEGLAPPGGPPSGLRGSRPGWDQSRHH
jgi:class 3 adenylate cyclase